MAPSFQKSTVIEYISDFSWLTFHKQLFKHLQNVIVMLYKLCFLFHCNFTQDRNQHCHKIGSSHTCTSDQGV